MATLPVVYALGVFVMVSYVSQAQDEVSNLFTLFPIENIKSVYYPPSRNSTQEVREGETITFLCSVNWEKEPKVYWYRVNPTRSRVASVQYYSGVCYGVVENQRLEKLHVGNTSCKDGSYELRIRDIDQHYDGGWFCVVRNEWRSRYIDLKVVIHDQTSTSRRTVATETTTSIAQTTVSRHETLSSIPAEAATKYTTERTDIEPRSGNTLIPLIGGAAGGGIVLLVVVITGCALYRWKRGSNIPDFLTDGQASTYYNSQPENAERVVMEGNQLYMSTDPGTDDYAQIDYRESASPSHEKGGAIVNNQPNPDDGKQSQAVLDSGDIYAMPDKSKKSAAEEKGEARLVNSQLNPGDRNQGQAVLDSGDIYAVPDKSKK